jgi:hypothetical protein
MEELVNYIADAIKAGADDFDGLGDDGIDAETVRVTNVPGVITFSSDDGRQFTLLVAETLLV